MSATEAFYVGLVIGVASAGAVYMAWPHIENRWKIIRNPMLRDPVYRELEAQIQAARDKHAPVKALLEKQQARVNQMLGA